MQLRKWSVLTARSKVPQLFAGVYHCAHFAVFEAPIPKGLCPPAQGCEARATLGNSARQIGSTPTGLRPCGQRRRPQPRWGWKACRRCTQGSSCLATLGFEPESLWDSRIGAPKLCVMIRPRGADEVNARSILTEQIRLTEFLKGDDEYRSSIRIRNSAAFAEALRPAAGHGPEHVEHDRHRAVHHDPAADVGAGRTAGACLGWLVALVIVIAGRNDLERARRGHAGFRRDRTSICAKRFGRERWGRLMAFLFIWQFILSGPLEIASGYIGFSQYIGYIWPDITPLRPSCRRQSAVGVLNIVLLYRRIESSAGSPSACGSARLSRRLGRDCHRRACISIRSWPSISRPGAFHFSLGFPPRPRRRPRASASTIISATTTSATSATR